MTQESICKHLKGKIHYIFKISSDGDKISCLRLI